MSFEPHSPGLPWGGQPAGLWMPTEPLDLGQAGGDLLLGLRSLTEPSRSLPELPGYQNHRAGFADLIATPSDNDPGTDSHFSCPSLLPQMPAFSNNSGVPMLVPLMGRHQGMLGKEVSLEGRIHSVGGCDNVWRVLKRDGYPQ